MSLSTCAGSIVQLWSSVVLRVEDLTIFLPIVFSTDDIVGSVYSNPAIDPHQCRTYRKTSIMRIVAQHIPTRSGKRQKKFGRTISIMDW